MESISIRSLQHYLYCPHRWGLMEIDRAWAENAFVVKANHLHERVHSGETYLSRRGKTYTGVDVWHDELGLVGKVDCLECRDKGMCIVEYKPTMPKNMDIRHEDAMQLFAQKLCLDQVLHVDCDTEMYYSDVKKRVCVTFAACMEDYLAELTQILSDMRHHLETGKIPAIRKGQQCSGCSMKELCMPSVLAFQRRTSLRKLIEKESEQ